MRKQIIVVAAVGMLIAYANAQSNESSRDVEPRSFSVAAAGDTAILLETETGRSWLLQQSVSDDMPSAWVPMQRLDSEDDVQRWRAEQAHRSHLIEELHQARAHDEVVRRRTSNEDLLRKARERVSELEAELDSRP